MGLLPIVIIAILLAAAVPIVIILLSSRGKKRDGLFSRSTDVVTREAAKKLAQNPHDAKALTVLAEMAYRTDDYQAARTYYKNLVDLCAAVPGIDEYDVTVKHGICALKLGDLDDAYKSLMYARNLKEDSFEANFHLGAVEYTRGEFEKACAYFQHAHTANPDHALTVKNLGASLYKIGRYKDAIPHLRRTLESSPDDKDTLFALGNASFEAGQTDMAMKIFTHLRTDPKLGPTASLYCGTIYFNSKLYDKAIMDLELGLRHEALRPEIAIELKYRLAFAYLKKEDISRAMSLWRDVQSMNPKFRDVTELISRYGELSSNRKLQTYMLAPTSDFVTLCRKIALNFYVKSKTKLLNISFRQSEYVDVVAEVDTTKWSDIILFRFVRTTGMIGELMLRDLYAKLKEIKGGRGVCIGPATYSDGAKAFVEARIIDLIDKPSLVKLLAKLPDGL